MHLWVDKDAGALELTLGGSGVGFCSAHVRSNAEFVTDLGNDAASCAELSAATFELGVELDAAPDANVVPANNTNTSASSRAASRLSDRGL